MKRTQRSNGAATCFVLVAGETSGDILGAGLIRSLRERFPEARFVGIGGPQMTEAGLETWYPADQLSVMGLVEVLRHLPRLLKIRRQVIRRTLALQPDCFIGIDAPDFNLPIERKLKSGGICTVHYVSPSIWAWREKRAEKIGKSADLVLCLFPMEPPIYARYKVNARYVGHPTADDFPLEPDRAAARQALGIAPDIPLLALLPGSRLSEIGRLGRDFLEAAQICSERVPNLQVIAPMANAACRLAFERQISKQTRVEFDHTKSIDSAAVVTVLWDSIHGVVLLDGQADLALRAADVALVASGTAALEAMLAKTPMVVAYRLAPITAFLVRLFRLMSTKRYSLPNILAERDLVPEFMQAACTPKALSDAALHYLATREVPTTLLAEFKRLHSLLRCNANAAAATAIAGLLVETPKD